MGIPNGVYLLFANDKAYWKRFWKIFDEMGYLMGTKTVVLNVCCLFEEN